MQLFHYTDVSAIKSILMNRKLWLSDMRFLNDSEEMNHGVKYIMDLVGTEGVQHRINKEYAEIATRFVIDGLADHVDFRMNFNPLFVCSFSRAEDLLSQWRAYGNYAVEFSAPAIGHPLSACIYDHDEKGRVAYDATLTALRTIGRSLHQNRGDLGRHSFEAYFHLVKVAAEFKHESFLEEREIRIIIEKVNSEYPIEFRERSGMLIPYIAVPVPFNSIKAIHIGPMREQELAYRSMCMFVDEANRIASGENLEFKEIKVVRSETPFRSA